MLDDLPVMTTVFEYVLMALVTPSEPRMSPSSFFTSTTFAFLSGITQVRIVSGEFWGKRGPVEGIAADPVYADVWVPPGTKKRLKVETSRNAFAYVFEGSGRFANASEPQGVMTEGLDQVARLVEPTEAGNRSLILFDRGDEIVVQAGEQGIRFLLVSGEPLKEPVAWWGPIVMNTRDELQQAIAELREGTFLKTG